ncbi:single-stranded-DNA-specific exonuclease RecJ [Inmirania thermothiophila]|uniref:Single-stranded-DNA-specific exonuclease RecJ n=1 Tax=Inmirania thermothiophila TaxID=1750597 RepID=A0A3N1Y6Y6_9GAMM|nr:DHH family phosphoesterase [Inmirania thermothiophila]ROR34584.1 single-stranded-DNA-specific exonuclease [Inmirania thermothiophila]
MTAERVWTGRWWARLHRRTPDPAVAAALEAAGLPPAAARVAATRLPSAALARPGLARLDHPRDLPGVAAAVERLAQALARDEPVAVVTDHDVDGVTAHAVLLEALGRHFGHRRLLSFIGHRLREGYGLSDGVAARILAARPRPALVITADCGSSDGERIARLAAAGIDVVVTDHHALPESGPPEAAAACVSPLLPGAWGDRAIAGVMVAWLLMCALRARLITDGRLPADAPHLDDLLDLVALGTVADCVSLATSANNRAVVRAGLARIEAGARPCWRVLRPHLGEGPVTARDLAFTVAPRINARGRLDEAMAGVRFLLAGDESEAARWLALLERENARRREIERALTEEAWALAEAAVARGRAGLALWLPRGHPGVHGIVASRVVERFGRPTACLSPHAADPALAAGSVRGIAGFHVRDALAAAAPRAGLVRYGGHAGAGGLTLPRAALEAFAEAFDEVATSRLDPARLGPRAESDGPVAAVELDDPLLDALAALEPWGRGFEPPAFELAARVGTVRPVGAEGAHLQLVLEAQGRSLRAIWFGAAGTGPRPAPGTQAHLLVTPEADHFRGLRRLSLRVLGLVAQPPAQGDIPAAAPTG